MDSFLDEPRKTPNPTPVIQEIQSPTVPEVSLMFQNLRKDNSTPTIVRKPVQSYNAWKLRSQPKNPQEFDSFLLTTNKENMGILQNGLQDRSFLLKKQVRFQSPVQKSPTTNINKKIVHLLPASSSKIPENTAYLASYYSGNNTMKQPEIVSKPIESITMNTSKESPSIPSKHSNTSPALLSTKNTKKVGCTDTMKNSESSNSPYSLTKPFEQLYMSNLPIPNRELDLSFLEPQKNPCARQEFFKKVYTASPDKSLRYSDYFKTIRPSFNEAKSIQENQMLEMNKYETSLKSQKNIVDLPNNLNTIVTPNENIKNVDNAMNNDENIDESTNIDLASKDCDKLETDSPTVKDLLTIIKLQNQQLQKLQSQVEKLVQINEIQELKKTTPLETTRTQNEILCKDQQMETSFEEHNIEQHHKHSNDLQDCNNKISVGLMTSFEVSFKPPPVKKNKKGRNLSPVHDIRYLQSIKQACYPSIQDRQYCHSSQDQQPVFRYPYSGQEVRYVQTAQQIQKVRYPSSRGLRYQQTTKEKVFSHPVQQKPYFQSTQQDPYSEDSDERQYYQTASSSDTKPLFVEAIAKNPSSESGQERPYMQASHERPYVQPAQERPFSHPTQERQFSYPTQDKSYSQPVQERPTQQYDKRMQYQQLNTDAVFAQPARENMFLEQTKGVQGYEENIQYQQQVQGGPYQNPVEDIRYRQSAKNIRFMQPPEPVENAFMHRDKVRENIRIKPQNEIGDELNPHNEQQYPQVWNKRKPNETEYSLGSQESLEVQDPPESPENSIHIDMQEYDTESDDSDDECSTEPGWTFYKDILGQVNNILENSSKPSYKPSRNTNKRYRNKNTNNTLEIIKNNAIQRLQNDGFLNTDDNVDVKPNEISFAVKQILMKYLPDQGLADVANFQDERFNGNNRKPNDLSVTTVKYMQQCNVVTNAPPCYDRKLQPDHISRTKTKIYPQQKSKILDITTLKQQPKLL